MLASVDVKFDNALPSLRSEPLHSPPPSLGINTDMSDVAEVVAAFGNIEETTSFKMTKAMVVIDDSFFLQ